MAQSKETSYVQKQMYGNAHMYLNLESLYVTFQYHSRIISIENLFYDELSDVCAKSVKTVYF